MPPPPGSPLRLHCPVISAPVAHSPRSPQLGSLGPRFAVNTRVSSLQPCTLTQGQSRLRRQGSGTRGSDRAEGDRHLQPPSHCDARLLPQHPGLGLPDPPAPFARAAGAAATHPSLQSPPALCPHPTGPERQRAGSATGPPIAGANQTLDKVSKLGGGGQHRGPLGAPRGGDAVAKAATFTGKSSRGP